MKQYDKAMEAYEKGLEYEPENPQLKKGFQDCSSRLEGFIIWLFYKIIVKLLLFKGVEMLSKNENNIVTLSSIVVV